jgi:hypothetical protein
VIAAAKDAYAAQGFPDESVRPELAEVVISGLVRPAITLV